MIPPLPVRTRRLYRRCLQTSEGRAEARAVLPLFTREGRVEKLLIVTDSTPALIDWRPGLVRVLVIGPIVLKESFAALSRGRSFTVPGGLWYDDPNRLIDAGDALVPYSCTELAAKNCSGRWTERIGSLYFKRDLSRIVMVSIKSSDGIKLARWKSKYLPDAGPCAAPSRPRRGGCWELDPIWR